MSVETYLNRDALREKLFSALHRLAPDANPVECESFPVEKAKEFRYLYCPHYSNCLDVASLCYWKSFTCLECMIFSKFKDNPTQATDEYLTREANKLAELAKERK